MLPETLSSPAATETDNKVWCVYIIETDNGSLYTGISNDVQRRWQHHLNGRAGAKFFRTSKPKRLLYLEPALNRSHASQREAQIKKLKPVDKQQLIRCQGPFQAVFE